MLSTYVINDIWLVHYIILHIKVNLTLCVYSLARSAPSQPGPTPLSKEKISISRSWWTAKRTSCGAQSWRGMFMHHQKISLAESVNNIPNKHSLLSLQDFRLPRPLHGCIQHGSRGQTETAGTVLECACDPTPVCPTQGLLCVWIAPVASYSKYIKHNASIQNQMSSLKEQGPLGDSLISQIQSQLWRDELRGWVEGSWPSDQMVVGRHCGAMRRTSFIDTWSAFVLDVC